MAAAEYLKEHVPAPKNRPFGDVSGWPGTRWIDPAAEALCASCSVKASNKDEVQTAARKMLAAVQSEHHPAKSQEAALQRAKCVLLSALADNSMEAGSALAPCGTSNAVCEVAYQCAEDASTASVHRAARVVDRGTSGSAVDRALAYAEACAMQTVGETSDYTPAAPAAPPSQNSTEAVAKTAVYVPSKEEAIEAAVKLAREIFAKNGIRSWGSSTKASNTVPASAGKTSGSKYFVQGSSGFSVVQVGGASEAGGPPPSAAQLKALHTRQDTLEYRIGAVQAIAHVAEACAKLGMRGFSLTRVPSDYYDWSLERRMQEVGAASTAHLCKSIIVENRKCARNDCVERNNSRFYCVIVQYITPFSAEKVLKVIKALNPDLSKKHFNFQHADDCGDLTGYKHNAVAPVGMATPMPIILSEEITKLSPGNMWLGGGHTDVKLNLNVKEFISTCDPIVGSISL